MKHIMIYVKNMEEEWEQKYMPAKCMNCTHEFEVDTDDLDLDHEDPEVCCENCGLSTAPVLVESLEVEEKLDRNQN